MFGFPTQLKYIVPPVLLILLISVIELFSSVTMPLLGFYTDLTAQGELWRIVTGQLTHTNSNHLLLNCLGILLVWSLHGEYYRTKHYFTAVIVHLLFIGLVLLYISPDNHHYAGYSAAIHAFIIYGGLIDIYRKEKTGYLVIIGTCLKVGHEIVFGASESTAELINASVATDAHLIGVVSGFLFGGVYVLLQYKKGQRFADLD